MKLFGSGLERLTEVGCRRGDFRLLNQLGIRYEALEVLFIGSAIERKVDRLVCPCAVEHGISQDYGMDAFFGWRRELFAVKDGIGEVLQDAVMLFTTAVYRNLHFPFFRAAE